jgi:5-methyltetrahydrofolate--homocysteine methyltransferase
MSFLRALNSGRTLLMDGAMGTELIRRGFTGPTWRANLDAPDLVRAIHADYVDAGAEVLLTNTFALNPGSLKDASLLSVGRAAVRLARSVARTRWVLGSMGPATVGAVNFADREVVLRIAEALDGVEGFVLETCSDASAFDAAAWIRQQFPELPVLVSFSFAPNEEGKAAELARAADKSPIAALGVNCGREQSPAEVGKTLEIFRRTTAKPLSARPNAGTPNWDRDGWRYPLAPQEWAGQVAKLHSLGLMMVGGCCGSTPDHIRELQKISACDLTPTVGK